MQRENIAKNMVAAPAHRLMARSLDPERAMNPGAPSPMPRDEQQARRQTSPPTPAPIETKKDNHPGGARQLFTSLATRVSKAVGSVWASLTAVLVVLVWAATGPLFHYSDTWQLVINTGTTIVTFLMVFLIQNSQNRDAKAMQLKLDELILVTQQARNQLIDAETLRDDQLESLGEMYGREKQEAPAENHAPELESVVLDGVVAESQTQPLGSAPRALR